MGSVIELVRSRCSWRSFDDRPLSPDLREQLEAALGSPPACPFGSSVRLTLIDTAAQPDDRPQKLGTYGVIRGARHFLAGAVQESERALEDFGFVFEWLILRATELGLGTCWLGGTFRRGAFGEALGVKPDEVVPAVSPVGFARSRRTVVDSVFRWAAASKKRRPFAELFFAQRFDSPLGPEQAGPWATALEMVRLGPSASNNQPWRMVYEPPSGQLHLFLQRTPGYRQRFAVDLQRLDMGIAMCHLELTARETGLPGRWTTREPDLGALPERTSYVATWTATDDEGPAAGAAGAG